ncbi:MAG: DUF1080 domain-containing protein [Cyclobacteriaceae bacterium]|nr:DUF1080 domain-containing protein [Cyclobacteriaceae bacterium]
MKHLVLVLLSVAWTAQVQAQDEWREKLDPKPTEVWKPVPVVSASPSFSLPPSDAIVLFDGKDLSQWVSARGGEAKWKVAEGAMTVQRNTGGIKTKREFGDVQLHIEWRTPSEATGEGQNRGNSGVYLQERYEVQVLDSYQNETYANGQAGALYKQHIPMVNASRKPGEWQSYDIVFTAPRFSEKGTLMVPAYVTVFHNGVLIHNHVPVMGPSVYQGLPVAEAHGKAAILLQDHGDAVSYRNIWVREL